jgi:hypothetical protein
MTWKDNAQRKKKHYKYFYYRLFFSGKTNFFQPFQVRACSEYYYFTYFSDSICEFRSSPLPVNVVDEELVQVSIDKVGQSLAKPLEPRNPNIE